MHPDPFVVRVLPRAAAASERELADLRRRAPPFRLTWRELAIGVALASSTLTVLVLLALGRLM